MKNSQPDPKTIHPVLNYYDLVYAKPLNKFKNVEIGEFTYIHDSTFGKQIEGLAKSPKDKLIIGKFCQIGKNVKFLLSGVNHKKIASLLILFICSKDEMKN